MKLILLDLHLLFSKGRNQEQTFSNVIVFNPAHVEVSNGKLKCTFPSELNPILGPANGFKSIKYFFEEEEGGEQLRRGNVPASISKSTKQAEGETFGSTNSVDDRTRQIKTNCKRRI